MKKTISILALTLGVSFTALADAVSYDSSKEIIDRIQLEMKHK
mgnify:FL=1